MLLFHRLRPPDFPDQHFLGHHPLRLQPKLVVTPLEPMSPDQVRRLLRVMESYVAGVLAEDYVPSPGLHCSYCDYLTQCRKWKGGGPC